MIFSIKGKTLSLELFNSDKDGKRFKAVFSQNGNVGKKTIHFGSDSRNTFLDGATEEKRINYIKRHRVNENWTGKPPTAGFLSRFVLWEFRNMNEVKSFLQKKI